MRDAHREAMENLKLPPVANKLWRRAGWRIAELLMERGCTVTLGGGTVLAARWGGHRQSFDIDFKVPAADAEKLVEAVREPEVRRGGLRPAGDGRHPGAVRTDRDREAPVGPLGSDAAAGPTA